LLHAKLARWTSSRSHSTPIDLPRARAFYERLLQTPPAGIFDPPGLLFFRAGSIRLLLEQGATSALIYFKVDDVRATLESLRADGVEIVAEPELIFSHTDDSLDRRAWTNGWRS
jgi:methylmalonyl-CoA/ethylmalonyl-CoA epimerase